MDSRTSKIRILVALTLLGGTQVGFAQNAENGRRLSERWCSECHAIDSASDKRHRAPSFASIAARPAIDADVIATFLLLPHATMPNPPLSRNDAQDIALFIVEMKK
jgi:cytochrome c